MFQSQGWHGRNQIVSNGFEDINNDYHFYDDYDCSNNWSALLHEWKLYNVERTEYN